MIFMLFQLKKILKHFFAYLPTLKNIQMFPETRHLLFFCLIVVNFTYETNLAKAKFEHSGPRGPFHQSAYYILLSLMYRISNCVTTYV